MVLGRREFYDNRAAALPAVDREGMLRARRAAALAGLAPGMSVLDLGCGRAVLRDELRAEYREIEYFGADISPAMLRLVEGGDDRHFQVLDILAGLPHAEGSFDRVFALEILEHLEYPLACLREIRRVLTGPGLAVVSVPNPYCWNEIVSNLRGRREGEGHLYSWTPQTMTSLAEVAGFAVRRQRGTCARIPLSRRLLGGRYRIVATNALLLARSLVYVLEPFPSP
ncbi:MAG: class I SAM-dependent methyltransferase [Acidobacteriota bacterium]